jgi:hypothetical protein
MVGSTGLELCENQSSRSGTGGRELGRHFWDGVVCTKGERQLLMVNGVQINDPYFFRVEIDNADCT